MSQHGAFRMTGSSRGVKNGREVLDRVSRRVVDHRAGADHHRVQRWEHDVVFVDLVPVLCNLDVVHRVVALPDADVTA